MGIVRRCALALFAATAAGACFGGDDDGSGQIGGTAGDGGPSGPAGDGGDGGDDGGEGLIDTCPEDPHNVGDPVAPQLAAPVGTEVVARPKHLRVGDITGDGLDDIAIVEVGEGGVFVVPSDGAGAFLEVFDLTGAVSAGLAMGLHVADLDGDGHDDVVVGYHLVDPSVPGILKVFWGGPGFPVDVAALEGDVLYSRATTVASGDFDGDGHVDLVGESPVGMYVSYGMGERAFEPGQLLTQDDLGTFVTDARAVDIDQDGRVEPIGLTAQTGFFGFRVYEVAADRSVTISQNIPSLPFPGTLSFFEDLNLDGAPDIIITGAPGIYVAWNQGGGEFDAYEADIYCTTTEDDLLPAASPFVAFTDLDGDGQLDVTAVESGDSELVFMFGRPEDRHLRKYARLPAGEYEPVAVLAGDFDGQGRPDLAVMHDHQGSLDGPFPLLVHLNATP